MTDRLKQLVNRIGLWPKQAQEEAIQSLRAIEEEYLGGNELSPEDQAALEHSAEDVRFGRLATDAETEDVFNRYRRA